MADTFLLAVVLFVLSIVTITSLCIALRFRAERDRARVDLRFLRACQDRIADTQLTSIVDGKAVLEWPDNKLTVALISRVALQATIDDRNELVRLRAQLAAIPERLDYLSDQALRCVLDPDPFAGEDLKPDAAELARWRELKAERASTYNHIAQRLRDGTLLPEEAPRG